MENSIGALVKRLLAEGKLDDAGAERAASLLRDRFGMGEKAPHPFLQDVRNVVSGLTLGQLGSGAVQLSEPLLSTYHHGWRPAIEAAAYTAIGKGIPPKAFGLANHLIEETMGSRFTGKVLGLELKANLLSPLDQLGIRQNLTASFIKNKRLAQTEKGRAELVRKWGADYAADMPQLIKDLQESTLHNRKGRVDSLLYQEIADVRPTSPTEMTQAHNANPNLRMHGHLKQFMITQMDIVRRDAWHEIRNGTLNGNVAQVARGVKNLVAFGAALAAVAVPANAIKDWLSGRKVDLMKTDVVSNIMQNFGISRYTLDKVETAKDKPTAVLHAATDWATPPAGSVVLRAAKGYSEPKALVPFIPLVGRPLYDRKWGNDQKIINDYTMKKAKERAANMTPQMQELLKEKERKRKETILRKAQQ